jgi:TrmH family RNA methyltransferase
MAAGADDVLAGARVCASLEEALVGCGTAIATTARTRSIPWPVLTPRAAAAEILEHAQRGPVALVFGRERSGLTNEEIDLCHRVVRIPAHREFSSLNLAAAVQIMAYELLAAVIGDSPSAVASGRQIPLASTAEMRQFYAHLEQCMIEVGFFDPGKPRRLRRRLRRLFNRAQLDQNEYNILRGFLAAIEKKIAAGGRA